MARVILVSVIALFAVPLTSMNLWAAAGTRTSLQLPTEVPSELPTDELPTDVLPTEEPTDEPSETPSEVPSETPSDVPTCVPEAPDPLACPPAEATQFQSSVTMAYSGKKFSGAVTSSEAVCQRDRTVVVRRVKNGKKNTVGRDQTDSAGAWSVRKANLKPGRYFATARAKTVALGECETARSKATRLPSKK